MAKTNKTTTNSTSTSCRSRGTPPQQSRPCRTPHHPPATPQQPQYSSLPPPPPQRSRMSFRLSNQPLKSRNRRHRKPQRSNVASSDQGSINKSQHLNSALAAANFAAAYATRDVAYAHLQFARQRTSLPSVGVNHPPIIGVSVATHPKVASSPLTTDSSGQRNTRDKGKDDTVAIVRDRQVKITEGASLYSLCRSWMKNGADKESQPPPPPSDVIMTLPKPLPLSPGDTQVSDKKEGEEEQAKEDEESVELLSTEDLLKRHVDRAKKVRAEFRKKRLEKIARYKNRLGLLLPPKAGPQSKNDAATGSNDAAARNLPPGHD